MAALTSPSLGTNPCFAYYGASEVAGRLGAAKRRTTTYGFLVGLGVGVGRPGGCVKPGDPLGDGDGDGEAVNPQIVQLKRP